MYPYSDTDLAPIDQNLILNAGFAMIATTTDGTITLFNQAAEKLLGYRADEVIHKETPLLFHLYTEVQERACKFSQELKKPVKPGFEVFVTKTNQGLNNNHEWIHVSKEQDYIPVLLSVSAIRDEQNQIKGYLGVAADLSQQKQVESDLYQTQFRLAQAQRLSKVGSWTLDLNQNKLEWSDEIYRLFEIDKNKFNASYEAFLDAIHPDDRERVNQAYAKSLKTKQPYEVTHRLLLPGNRVKHVREACETIYNDNGQAILSQGIVQDVTQQKLDEEKINLYATIFVHNPYAILITDARNQIIAINPALSRLTGYSEHELLGQNPRILSSELTTPEAYKEMWQSISQYGRWQGELIDKAKNGRTYPKLLTISVIKDSNNNILNYIGIFSDISERKAAEKQIQYLAHHDSLTGLYNRFSLEERLGQSINQAKQLGLKIAVVFIDLDNFKKINDTLGHHTGDRLLKQVAKRLSQLVHTQDIVARLGGDEFVVVLNNIKYPQYVDAIASNIVHSLSQAYKIEGHELQTSPSIGISIFPDDGDDGDRLMQFADTAMYHAKELGRRNFQYYTEQMNTDAQERIKLEKDIVIGLKEEQFELYYQPKIDSSTGKTNGLEALIRWNHPEKGFVSPDFFIPMAEETGIIECLGEWVILKACEQLAQLKSMGFELTMAINLSPKQLQDKNLITTLQEALDSYGLHGSDLELEITETAAMNDADTSIALMQTIRTLDISLAIDDFGTGYSSLAYLKLFPIQTLKLDRTFVSEIGVENQELKQSDTAIALASIALAHSLGLQMVAEGVETAQQRDFLIEHQCHSMQGYFFSRPLPFEDLVKVLNKSK